jgi:hypothetical protein
MLMDLIFLDLLFIKYSMVNCIHLILSYFGVVSVSFNACNTNLESTTNFCLQA